MTVFSCLGKICLGLGLAVLSCQSLPATETNEQGTLESLASRVTALAQTEEAGAGARFLGHLLTDPIEITRQATNSTSATWLVTADIFRFGTIAYNLYHLYQTPHDLTAERICELLHYLGDAGERLAVAVDYTGSLQIAMNILQFGSVAGYIGIRAYKHFYAPATKTLKQD